VCRPETVVPPQQHPEDCTVKFFLGTEFIASGAGVRLKNGVRVERFSAARHRDGTKSKGA
jgi:hypothetical protein